MTNIEQQVAQARQQVAQKGISGDAILDIHPSRGIVKIKINLVPPERTAEFINNYVNVLQMTLNTMNINVGVHVAEGE